MVLSEAGFVKMRKTGRGPRTQTTIRLTANGRRRFVEYINVLESVVSDAHVDAEGKNQSKAGGSTEFSPA